MTHDSTPRFLIPHTSPLALCWGHFHFLAGVRTPASHEKHHFVQRCTQETKRKKTPRNRLFIAGFVNSQGCLFCLRRRLLYPAELSGRVGRGRANAQSLSHYSGDGGTRKAADMFALAGFARFAGTRELGFAD
jgi:hypothetical protein